MTLLKQTRWHQPGDRIAGYSVLARIGGGSYGEVYLVRDVTGAKYAMKILQNGNEHEFAALQKMREIPPCPGLTALHAAGYLPDGKLYYLMDAADDLLTGELYLPDTLANRMARQGHLPVKELLELAAALLPAVRHLHAHGTAHYDIKPENIIFVRHAPMLADFGSVDLCGPAADIPVVTNGFFPPEEFSSPVNGPHSAKNDLYALGMTLYCAWSGHPPEDYALLPDDVDPAGIRVMRKLLLKACNAAPAYRFQDADEFLRAVRKAQQQLAPPRPRSFRRILVYSGAVLLFTLAGILPVHTVQKAAREKRWQNVERKVELARLAEAEGILPELRAVRAAVRRENGPFPAPDTETFQRLHDLLQEYREWRKAPSAERRARERKLAAMAEQCPQSYRNPVPSLLRQLQKQRELSAKDKALLRRLAPVCGNAGRQLQLEIASTQKNPNLTPEERERRLKQKERQLRELRERYALETEYMELCQQLHTAHETKEILRLSNALQKLKIRLQQIYFSGSPSRP